METAINARNVGLTEDMLEIESQLSQVSIAFATSLPTQINVNQAELMSMLDNTLTLSTGIDTAGLSVSDKLGSTTESVIESLNANKDAIVEKLSQLYDISKEEANTVYESATKSYSSGGGSSSSGYSSSTIKASQGQSGSGMTSTQLAAAAAIEKAKADYANATTQAQKDAAHAAANAARVTLGISASDINKDGTIKGYAGGIENGAITYTGLAMLHGSPSKPEYVLNSDQAYNLLRYMSLKRPEIQKTDSNNGDSWILNGDIVLENCNNPAEFWDDVTKAMSNRFNVTKNRNTRLK